MRCIIALPPASLRDRRYPITVLLAALTVFFYATAALVGGALMVMLRQIRVSTPWAAALGGVTCFLLRVISLWRHWNLPRVMD